MTRLVLVFAFGVVLLVGFAPIDQKTDEQPEQKFETAPRPRLAGRQSVPHKVFRVTPPDAVGPAEVAVAINPSFSDHIVVSSLQAQQPTRPFTNNHTYNSHDGGRTWKAIAASNAERRTQADDSVAFGPEGRVYHCYLSAVGYRESMPLRAASGIFVRRSLDGLTWDDPVPVVDHVNTVEPFEDKPWIAVDDVRNSPHRGNVYVAWTRFDKYGSRDPEHRSRIYLSRSRDGGKSFSPPVRLSDQSGNARDDADTVEGAVPAIGPKGEVYVAWAGPGGIHIDKSVDGGATFGEDVKVADQPGGWTYSAAGIRRHNGLPITGCDTSRSKFNGRVYVCWGDKRNDDADVFVAASEDGGKTWGEPVRVNNDLPKNGRDQAFPWMAVDPVDGSVNVVFFDTRDNPRPNDRQLAVTVARSVDGGQTFANFAVDLKPFPIGSGFLGDYNGIAARGGRVVAVFPHFVSERDLAVSVTVFRFRPFSLDARNE